MLGTRQSFQEELVLLEQQLLHMGRLTGSMVDDAVLSIQQGDVFLAEAVIEQDDAIDTLNADIETRCMRLLALQQPMARDLRQIGTALKIVTDLERIGDHAVDIAKISRKLSQQLFIRRQLVDVGPLAEMAQRMLARALEALVRHDATLSEQICAEDDRVDDTFKELREQLFGMARDDASLSAAASYMLLAIVYLERIADHATNIAERVHYIETGNLVPLSRDLRRAEVMIDAVGR